MATVATLKDKGFGVYSTHTGEASFSDFNNQQVTYKYSKWTYTPVKYWPTTPGTINFFAYAPYDKNTTLTENTKIDFTVEKNVANQTDLLWARTHAQIKTPITNNNKVSFQFAHALSRLDYTIKLHEQYPSAKFTLKKITLAGSPDETTNAFYTKGIIDLSKVKNEQTDDAPTGLWNTSSSDKQNFDWVSESESYKVENKDPNDPKKYLFVIPQNFSKDKTKQDPNVDELYIIVQYTINYDGGGEQTNTVYKQIKKDFKQGKAYKINLTIGLPIEFDVNVDNGVDDWGPEDGINIGSDGNLWDGIK